MKKITEEEAKELAGHRIGRNPVRKELMQLAVGEYFLVERKDLGNKSGNVPDLCRRIEKTNDMLFQCALTGDKNGYVVKRLK
jgi:hypothetical protein